MPQTASVCECFETLCRRTQYNSCEDFGRDFVEKRSVCLFRVFGAPDGFDYNRKCVASGVDDKCAIGGQRQAEVVVNTEEFWDSLYRKFDSDFNDA